MRDSCELRRLVMDAVAATSADGILLSGGLDTSIVAVAAAASKRPLTAITVAVRDSESPDEPFARRLAAGLGMRWIVLRPSLEELLQRMPEAIAVLGSFDPMELRNSIVAHVALAAARDAGIGATLTGDAADELFAGYSYVFNMPAGDIPLYIRYIEPLMRFSSEPLAAALGLRAELPFCDPAVRQFALTLDAGDFVGERDGVRFGKKILREAFSSMLPGDFAWRVKTPIEYGSGSTALRALAERSIGDDEFRDAAEQAAAERVQLRDKEHCLYYRMYRRMFGPPAGKQPGAKSCPGCLGPVERANQRYCRICGAYPI